MANWIEAAKPPQLALGDTIEIWVCVKNQKGDLRTCVAYFVNHPLPQEDEDGEFPDWASLNCDGDPADFVGFARLLSHPDYDGYYEPLRGVTHWAEIEYPEVPAAITQEKQQ